MIQPPYLIKALKKLGIAESTSIIQRPYVINA
jgi:hypothetical protein